MSALILYGLITVFSGGLLFVMALFGADHDIDVDVDADVDVGLDGFEAGGPSVLSLKLILIFLIGFGLCGFLSAYFKTQTHHVILALIGGSAIWFVSYQALSWLYRQQSSSHVRGVSFVGQEAKVTVPIPKAGSGEVFCRIEEGNKSIYLNARAQDSEKEYQKGQTVTIRSVEGTTAIVE
jgi:membrane protein implicated in regulation of membrane protease activity